MADVYPVLNQPLSAVAVVLRSVEFYASLVQPMAIGDMGDKGAAPILTQAIVLTTILARSANLEPVIIALATAAVATSSKVLAQATVLLAAVAVTRSANLSVSQPLVSKPMPLAYNDNASDCAYAPWISAGALTPPPATLTLGTRTSVLFDDGLGNTLQIKNPSFGNVDTMDLHRLVLETRGGETRVFRDSNWPTDYIFKIKFRALCDADALALQNFLLATPGRLMTYTDHENREWEGLLTTPDSGIPQVGKKNFECELIFIGRPA